MEILEKFGLSSLQQNCFLHLIDNGPRSVAILSTELNQKRTTVHMALEKLLDLGLVEKSNESNKWQAKNPTELKRILNQHQEDLKQSSRQLQVALPRLISRYRLSHLQPGVMHIEGKEGIKQLYDDIIRVGKEVLIFPSSHDRENPTISATIDAQILRQQLAGINVRSISPESRKGKLDSKDLKKKKIEVRFFGENTYEAQTIIYGDNVAISTFGETMNTTIITSKEIANTYKAMFENQWVAAH